MSLIKPIFIVGYPRSGTTLLQCMLSANSKLFSLPETHFFSEAMRAIGKPADEYLSIREIRRVFGIIEHMLISGGLYDEFMDYCDENPATGKQIFEFIVEHHRPERDTDGELRVIEKTPMHAIFIDEIIQLFPDAKFIHIIRDPRDAIGSVLSMPMVKSKRVLDFINRANKTISYVDSRNQNGENFVFTEKYENLVENPADTIRAICGFLNIVFEPGMIDSFSEQFEKNVVSTREYWKSDVGCGRILKHEAKWKTRITEAQAWLIEVGTYRLIRLYGYEFHCNLSIRARMKAILDLFLSLGKEKQNPFHSMKPFLNPHLLKAKKTV